MLSECDELYENKFNNSHFAWEQILELPIERFSDNEEFECIERVMHIINGLENLNDNVDDNKNNTDNTNNNKFFCNYKSCYRLTILLKLLSYRCCREIEKLRNSYFELWRNCISSQSSCSEMHSTMNLVSNEPKNNHLTKSAKEELFTSKKESIILPEMPVCIDTPNRVKYNEFEHDWKECQEHEKRKITDDYKPHGQICTTDELMHNEENNRHHITDKKMFAVKSEDYNYKQNVHSDYSAVKENKNEEECISLHPPINKSLHNIDPYMQRLIITKLTEELSHQQFTATSVTEKLSELHNENTRLINYVCELENHIKKMEDDNNNYIIQLEKCKVKYERVKDNSKFFSTSYAEIKNVLEEILNEPKNGDSAEILKNNTLQKLITMRKREEVLERKLQYLREKYKLAEIETSRWTSIAKITVEELRKEIMENNVKEKKSEIKGDCANLESNMKSVITPQRVHTVNFINNEDSVPTINGAEYKLEYQKEQLQTSTQIEATMKKAKDGKRAQISSPSCELEFIYFLTEQVHELTLNGFLTSDIEFVSSVQANWKEYFEYCNLQNDVKRLYEIVRSRDAYIDKLLNEEQNVEQKEFITLSSSNTDNGNEKASTFATTKVLPVVSAEKQQIALYLQRLNEKEAEIDLLETQLAESHRSLEKYHKYIEILTKEREVSLPKNMNLESIVKAQKECEVIESLSTKVQHLEKINIELIQHLLDVQYNAKILQIEVDHKNKEIEILQGNTTTTTTATTSHHLENEDVSKKMQNDKTCEQSNVHKELLSAALYEQVSSQKRIVAQEQKISKMKIDLLATKASEMQFRTKANTYQRSCYSVYRSYMTQVRKLCEFVRAQQRCADGGIGMYGAIMLRKQNDYLTQEMKRLESDVKLIRTKLLLCNENIYNNEYRLTESEHLCSVSTSKRIKFCNNIQTREVTDNCQSTDLLHVRRKLIESELDKEYAYAKIARLESQIEELINESRGIWASQNITTVIDNALNELRTLSKSILLEQPFPQKHKREIVKLNEPISYKHDNETNLYVGMCSPITKTDDNKSINKAKEYSNFLSSLKSQEEEYLLERKENEIYITEKERQECIPSRLKEVELSNKECENVQKELCDMEKTHTDERKNIERELHKLRNEVLRLRQENEINENTITRLQSELEKSRVLTKCTDERLDYDKQKSQINMEKKSAEMQDVRNSLLSNAVSQSIEALYKLLKQKNATIKRLEEEIKNQSVTLMHCQINNANKMEHFYNNYFVENENVIRKFTRDVLENNPETFNSVAMKHGQCRYFENDYNTNPKNEHVHDYLQTNEIDIHIDNNDEDNSIELVVSQLSLVTERVIYLQKLLQDERQVNNDLREQLTKQITLQSNLFFTKQENVDVNLHAREDRKEEKKVSNLKELLLENTLDVSGGQNTSQMETYTQSTEVCYELMNMINTQKSLINKLREQLEKREKELDFERQRYLLVEEELHKQLMWKQCKLEKNSSRGSISCTNEQHEPINGATAANKVIAGDIKPIRSTKSNGNNDNNNNNYNETGDNTENKTFTQKLESGMFDLVSNARTEQSTNYLMEKMIQSQKDMINYVDMMLTDFKYIKESMTKIKTSAEKVQLAVSILKQSSSTWKENADKDTNSKMSNNYFAVMHRIDALMGETIRVSENVCKCMIELKTKASSQREEQFYTLTNCNKLMLHE